MGLLNQFSSLFFGLSEFMTLWHDIFAVLPLVVQVLIYFTFGSFLLLGIVQMLRSR